jgi:hypothetical protein
MRAAVVIAMSVVTMSVLATAVARAEPRDQQTPHITILKVHVVQNPVITPEMMSPRPTIPQKPIESAMASR